MKYYKDLHDGIIPEEDVLDDKDVADEEMAAALVFFFSWLCCARSGLYSITAFKRIFCAFL